MVRCRARMPRASHIVLLFARALRLRCPACAGGPLFASWFRIRDTCPGCGLALARHEEGYYLGAMALNLFVSEALFALLLVGVAVWTWPDVPWDTILFVSVVLMILAPVAFFPFSRTLWLAFDLLVRPVTRGEIHSTRRDA